MVLGKCLIRHLVTVNELVTALRLAPSSGIPVAGERPSSSLWALGRPSPTSLLAQAVLVRLSVRVLCRD